MKVLQSIEHLSYQFGRYTMLWQYPCEEMISLLIYRYRIVEYEIFIHKNSLAISDFFWVGVKRIGEDWQQTTPSHTPRPDFKKAIIRKTSHIFVFSSSFPHPNTLSILFTNSWGGGGND